MIKIFLIIKAILKSKLFVLYLYDNKELKKITSEPDLISKNFYDSIAKDSKETFIQAIGEQNYGIGLESYDNDLFNAYKECDYHIAHANYLEAELNYYKIVNDPMGGDANITYTMYRRLQDLKNKYENFK